MDANFRDGQTGRPKQKARSRDTQHRQICRWSHANAFTKPATEVMDADPRLPREFVQRQCAVEMQAHKLNDACQAAVVDRGGKPRIVNDVPPLRLVREQMRNEPLSGARRIEIGRSAP